MLYELDIDYGLNNEKICIDKIEKFFNEKLVKLDYYKDFDFTNSDNTLLIELKSRRCKISDYNDTIISISKINKSRKIVKTKGNKTKIYFFFYFTNNDLYYWMYDHKIDLRIDNIEYRNQRKINYYIPTALLKKSIKIFCIYNVKTN